MKHFFFSFIAGLLLVTGASAQDISYTDAWGQPGMSLIREMPDGVTVNFSISDVYFEDVNIDGESMQSVKIPGVFLPNDEGAPDLPGTSKFIAIPEGAKVNLHVKAARTEKLENVLVGPAPRIPLDTDKGPLHYEKNPEIYNKDAFYPEQPVIISDITQIRGVDVVQLGVTPFQYNPVTKELIVYRDLEIELEFTGGNGHFGEDRLRSRWFDRVLFDAVMNYESLPVIDYDKPGDLTEQTGYEYLIIVPNDGNFIAWADSIKRFRTHQGILTGVVTTTEIGGNNANTIENYINNAYNTWTIPPVAVLLLGDYGVSGNTVASPIYNGYCVSDNIYADVNNDHMPDMIFARMTAQYSSHLETMVTKALSYERNPPTNPNFYDHPITALGWQTSRWFQICSETVGGFWKNVQGKNPVRINAIYSGTPGSVWSTATNTNQVTNYFGPNGLGYIPATPAELGGWSGGTAYQVNNAINSGAFMMQHRDHGGTTGWGEPDYHNSDINGLHNSDLVFVFSINCLTGKYNISGECFTEKFHRHTYNNQNAGALGLIAASEVSYSFVNDTYVWGMFDNMWPNFMPENGAQFATPFVYPSFGNAAGKYFLKQSSWPYNTNNKQVTYHLFHHHGDAFTMVYSEVPQNLSITHNSVHYANETVFTVTAEYGAHIALTVNDVIIGTAYSLGNPIDIQIPQLNPGEVIRVTATKQNYFRYTSLVDVLSPNPRFELKAYLEGPYNGSEMYRFLNTYGYMPLSQPYNTAPWNYNGSESVTSIPSTDIVDWVLLEIRETQGGAPSATPSTTVGRMAGFILRDGSIVDIDGVSPLEFVYNFSGNIYTVLYHRNHLGIMSAYPLTENNNLYVYDFTTGSNMVFGGSIAQKEISPGVWGMVAGDGDCDGQVTTGDKVEIWSTETGMSGYRQGDFNMNGNVDNTDKIQYWGINAGRGSQVPE